MVTVETISEVGIYRGPLLWPDSLDSYRGKTALSCQSINLADVPVKPAVIQTPSRSDRSTVVSDQQKDGWISYIQEVIYSISDVENIYVEIAGNEVDVWVIIPKRDIAVVRQIVESEGEIVRTFASVEDPAFLLDFHVVYRNGRDESLFVPELAIRLPKTL